MKCIKLLTLSTLVFLTFLSTAFAIDWHKGDTIAVGWDATQHIAVDDVIGYYVFLKDVRTGEQLGEIDTALHGKAFVETVELSTDIAIPREGRFIVGVTSYRIPSGEVEPISSVGLNWSDVDEPTGATPVPFGSVYFVEPVLPMGFQVMQ